MITPYFDVDPECRQLSIGGLAVNAQRETKSGEKGRYVHISAAIRPRGTVFRFAAFAKVFFLNKTDKWVKRNWGEKVDHLSRSREKAKSRSS